MIQLERKFAERFIRIAEAALEAGIIEDIDLISGYRTFREQAELFRRFHLGQTDLPVAEPGKSYHNYGLAVDISVSPADALEEFAAYAESRGFRWGGHFGDPVHFDVGRTISLASAKRFFKKGQLVDVEA